MIVFPRPSNWPRDKRECAPGRPAHPAHPPRTRSTVPWYLPPRRFGHHFAEWRMPRAMRMIQASVSVRSVRPLSNARAAHAPINAQCAPAKSRRGRQRRLRRHVHFRSEVRALARSSGSAHACAAMASQHSRGSREFAGSATRWRDGKEDTSTTDGADWRGNRNAGRGPVHGEDRLDFSGVSPVTTLTGSRSRGATSPAQRLGPPRKAATARVVSCPAGSPASQKRPGMGPSSMADVWNPKLPRHQAKHRRSENDHSGQTRARPARDGSPSRAETSDGPLRRRRRRLCVRGSPRRQPTPGSSRSAVPRPVADGSDTGAFVSTRG